MIEHVYKFIDKKISISTVAGSNDAQNGITVCPPLLKTLSEDVLVA